METNHLGRTKPVKSIYDGSLENVKLFLARVSTVKINPGVGCYPLAELSESARPCVTTCDSLFIGLVCWFVRMSLDQDAIMVTSTNLRELDRIRH